MGICLWIITSLREKCQWTQGLPFGPYGGQLVLHYSKSISATPAQPGHLTRMSLFQKRHQEDSLEKHSTDKAVGGISFVDEIQTFLLTTTKKPTSNLDCTKDLC